jgi:hypothetical protein
MMMGIGFWIMLLLLAVPIMLVVGLLVLMIGPFLGHPASQASATRNHLDPAPATDACPHCGARLQREWVHCPQCGAPTKG